MGMRRYAADDEERIRLQTEVRDWTRAGLLDRAQGDRLAAGLAVNLRRTHAFLRAGLALFTLLIVGASVALVFVVFRLSGDGAIAATTAVAAGACLAGADLLAGRFRFYRYGIEEMLAASAVVLIGISTTTFVSATFGRAHSDVPTAMALAVAAAAALGVYLRFGLQYFAIGAMACAAAAPFQFYLEQPTERLLAAGILTAAFVLTRWRRGAHTGDYLAGDYAVLHAAAFVGVYLVLNLYLTSAFPVSFGAIEPVRWFKWFTYALTWSLPAAGLAVSVRGKDRELLDASGAMMLVTLVTSKPYLGWPRHSWDPMLFGAILITAALGIRRWIARGPGGQRRGFTFERLRASEVDALRVVANVSAGFQPARPAPAPAPQGFGGGRSGGGGAGADF